MLSFFKSDSFDQEIIAGLQAGGSQRRMVEKKLFEHFFYLIKQGVYKHSIAEEEAASAYSDTIISVIENVVSGKFENRSSLKSYTYQIFSNKCIDVVRKESAEKSKVHHTMAMDSLLMALPDKAQNSIQRLIDKSQRYYLLQSLQEVGEKCKKLLLLYEDGYNDKEIASMMEYNSAGVVKTSRLRCLEKLREKMRNPNRQI